MIRIDSHQHFWKPERADYGWLTPELPTLFRDFLPTDLLPLLRESGIDLTIVVQAAPTVAETRYLLDLAASHDWIAGVVGWIDFEDPDSCALLPELARDPHLVGIRPMVQDIEDPNWIARSTHAPVFEAIIENGLVFDALIKPPHLLSTLEVVRRHPDLPVVIDHCAKPTLADGVGSSWFDGVSALAEFPQVSCKLSGLVTEAREDWKVEDLVPVVDHVLKEFGANRILWGSDWPVLTLAGDYPSWWNAVQQLLAGLPDHSRESVLGGNARRIYLS